MIENEAVAVALIGAVSTLVGIFLKGLWDLFRGKHSREREKETDRRDTVSLYKEEAKEAYDRAMVQWERARAFALHSHAVEMFCIREHGTDPSEFPPWPEGDKKEG